MNHLDLSTLEKPYVITETDHARGMWLASPSTYVSGICILTCNYKGTIGTSSTGFKNVTTNVTEAGFRPLVCLKSDIQLQKSEDGNYTIIGL